MTVPNCSLAFPGNAFPGSHAYRQGNVDVPGERHCSQARGEHSDWNRGTLGWERARWRARVRRG
jgi:hypothetical protein